MSTYISTNNGKIISSKSFTPLSPAGRSLSFSPTPMVNPTTTVIFRMSISITQEVNWVMMFACWRISPCEVVYGVLTEVWRGTSGACGTGKFSAKFRLSGS